MISCLFISILICSSDKLFIYSTHHMIVYYVRIKIHLCEVLNYLIQKLLLVKIVNSVFKAGVPGR